MIILQLEKHTVVLCGEEITHLYTWQRLLSPMTNQSEEWMLDDDV